MELRNIDRLNPDSIEENYGSSVTRSVRSMDPHIESCTYSLKDAISKAVVRTVEYSRRELSFGASERLVSFAAPIAASLRRLAPRERREWHGMVLLFGG